LGGKGDSPAHRAWLTAHRGTSYGAGAWERPRPRGRVGEHSSEDGGAAPYPQGPIGRAGGSGHPPPAERGLGIPTT